MPAQKTAQKTIDLLEKARQLQKYPLGRLVSAFETDTEAFSAERAAICSEIQENSENYRDALIIGITGTPGAGKSSLINALCMKLLEKSATVTIAVLAVDPSSAVSGGSLLGDRTRTTFPIDDPRVYFRSQASDLELGGVSHRTFQATRILRKLFDIVLIETVGIGQSEMTVGSMVDQTILVMQPLAGDQVQFIKAGIMEQPDLFVINKCDEEKLARQSRALLKSSLKVANLDDRSREIIMTSATTGLGIEELADFVERQAQSVLADKLRKTQEIDALRRWAQIRWGSEGLKRLWNDELKADNLDYEARESALLNKAKALNWLE